MCVSKLRVMHMRVSHGYSLIELVVIIVVLAVALTGVTLAINQVVRQSPEALVQSRAMELAQTYMDEIITKRFDENSGQGGIPRCDSTDNAAVACSGTLGPDTGEPSRQQYDDVDDYHNLTETPPVSIVTAAPLNPVYDGYQIHVDVSYAGTELGMTNNQFAKRITISITTPLGNVLPVSAYRVNF